MCAYTIIAQCVCLRGALSVARFFFLWRGVQRMPDTLQSTTHWALTTPEIYPLGVLVPLLSSAAGAFTTVSPAATASAPAVAPLPAPAPVASAVRSTLRLPRPAPASTPVLAQELRRLLPGSYALPPTGWGELSTLLSWNPQTGQMVPRGRPGASEASARRAISPGVLGTVLRKLLGAAQGQVWR